MKSAVAIAILSCVLPLRAAQAQTADPSSAQIKTDVSTATTSGKPTDLAAQIAELRSAIARLESSIGANPQPMNNPSLGSGMGKMGGMMDDMMGGQSATGGMTGMGGKGDGMGQMPPSGTGGAVGAMEGMDSREMSMEMGMMATGSMGQQSGPGSLRASALPGFPGASHIYHIGSTGFFLDHPEHVSLDTAQQQGLNQIKQGALLERASFKRKLSEAEQQLWELTGAEQPDVVQIQSKVEEIAKLRSEQRLSYIRAVGEAAKILTNEQRQILLGLAQPGEKQPHTHAHPSK